MPLVQGHSLLHRAQTVVPHFSARVGWTLYTLGCCVVFLVLTFPTDVLLPRMVGGMTRRLPVRLHYTDGEITWWGSCRLREVEMTYGTAPTVKIAHLAVYPSLAGLILGRPWPLSFTAELYGGTLKGTVTADASGPSVQIAAERLDLRAVPLSGIVKGGEVQGLLSGEGQVRGNGAALFSWQGQVRVTVSEGALRAGAVSGFPLPSLSAVEAELRATAKNGLVNIVDFAVRAESAEARLQGSISLATPLPMSTLNLQMTAKTLGTTSSPLTVLISLLPAAPDTSGVRQVTISGSLAAPILR